MGEIISFQAEFSQRLPEVIGNADYRNFKTILFRIDELISLGRLEQPFIEFGVNQAEEEEYQSCLEVGRTFNGLSSKTLARVVRTTRQAFRCVLILRFLGLPFRKLACRLADSPLLQKFCLLDQIDRIKVPSKSSLERYSKMFPEPLVRSVINCLSQWGSLSKKDENKFLGLEKPVSFDRLYMDATCVEANIHFPVDWVLLRDATRTLMKAVSLIRKEGLKNRMEAPSSFIRSMNKLCIAITHARNRSTRKKIKKTIFRQMKKLMKKIEQHAQKHLVLLQEQWKNTKYSRREARRIIERIENVLNQLPAAIFQAHERIIGERMVRNKDKILSLYEKEIHVCVRGKAGTPVEFGNTLVLSEQENGVILDWKLYEEQSPGDPKLLKESLHRLDEWEKLGIISKSITTDRGMFSHRNQILLENRNIRDFMCPRNPSKMALRLSELEFCLHQKRRAQTEGRIGILKKNFFGEPFRSKSFEHRSLSVTWAILAHNLWVIARLPKSKRKKLPLAA